MSVCTATGKRYSTVPLSCTGSPRCLFTGTGTVLRFEVPVQYCTGTVPLYGTVPVYCISAHVVLVRSLRAHARHSTLFNHFHRTGLLSTLALARGTAVAWLAGWAQIGSLAVVFEYCSS